MTTAVGALDEAIKEYLVFRGFTSTLKHFELERKDDKDKGFKVNRIVDHLTQCINRSDFTSLQSFWVYLHKRFFSRLSHDSLMTVYRLETNLLRLFLVYASRQGKQDVVKDFFEKMADTLQDKKEWKDWFAFPFTKNPDQHPTFKLYYSKEWGDTFVITLHNFFSTLFSCLPALLNFEAEHQKMQSLATENQHLHHQLANTKHALIEAESNVQKLEARLAQQLAAQTATRRTTVSGGKAPKSSKRSLSPWREKMASFGGASSIKRPTRKTTSLDDMDKTTEGQDKPEVLKQTSEPATPAKNEQGLSLGGLNRDQIESDLDLPSPGGVVDEGYVKTFPNSDDVTPFLPVSQEVYREHSAPITHCKFSPNATRVATVDTDGTMRVWNPNTLSTFATVELRSSLLSLDWAPQSDSLVLIGSGDGVVGLYDSNSSKYHWDVKSDNRYPKVLSIACSASSNTFAFSAAASVGATPPLHSGSFVTMGLTAPGLPSSRFTQSEMHQLKPAGGQEVTTGERHIRGLPPAGGVFIWDLKTQKQKCSLSLSPLPVGVNCMAFNHNSNLLITGGTDGMIRLFDVAQNECLCGWNAHDGEVFNVQFSSDETSVYSMGRDNKFCQWSINRSGQKVTEFNVHEKACEPTGGSVRGEYFPNTPRGNLFAFESEDKFVLTCSPKEAIVYQLGSEGSLAKSLSISGHSGPVTCVDWLQGRRSFSTCLTGSMDNSIKLTNLLKSSVSL